MELKRIIDAFDSFNVEHSAEVTSLRQEKTDLHSTLAIRDADLAGANERMATLQIATAEANKTCEEVRAQYTDVRERVLTLMLSLETAQKEATVLNTEHDVTATRLQNGSRSENGCSPDERDPGIGAFQEWMLENSIAESTPVSEEDHTVLAHNALRNVHLGEWSLAYENAQRVLVGFPPFVSYIHSCKREVSRYQSISHGLHCQGLGTNWKG